MRQVLIGGHDNALETQAATEAPPTAQEGNQVSIISNKYLVITNKDNPYV